MIAVEVKAKSNIKEKDIANIIRFSQNSNNKLLRTYIFCTTNEFIPFANKKNLEIYLVPIKILT